MRKIRFTLKNGDTLQDAHPIYSGNFGISAEREEKRVFFRNKLNEALTFVAEDYSWIMSQPFDALIEILIFVYDDGVLAFSYKGSFARTNCTINEVDGILKVTPDTVDDYEDILAKMDVEVNLAELPIPQKKILFAVPNILQVYKAGAASITNWQQSDLWAVDVDAISGASELRDNYFYNSFGFWHPVLSNGINAELTVATFSRPYNQSYITFETTGGAYKLSVTMQDNGHKALTLYRNNVEIGGGSTNDDVANIFDNDNVWICTATLNLVEIWCRLISHTSGLGAIKEFGNIGKNYRYARPITTTDNGINVSISQNLSNDPTKWGAVYDGGIATGQYYLPPTTAGHSFFPILQNYWGKNFSVWLDITDTQAWATLNNTRTNINGCYEIGDIISAVLTAVGCNVQFVSNTSSSLFLYDPTSPVSGWHTGWRLFLTQKSNVANINAESAAAKVPCTLATILDFLKNALNVYWHVEGGLLHLEHISYYRNGGNYGGTPTVGYDLTAMINPRNGKPWAFGQNEYNFEKFKMPEFVKWSWMDGSDLFFDGSGFVCISNYVQKGNTEEITVANVTSNINYIVTHPESVSLDGFAAIFTVQESTLFGGFKITGSDVYWQAQNTELAMWNLQPSLLLYDTPCADIQVSGSEYHYAVYKRTKNNEVTFPAPNINPLHHIVTNVGDGEIDSVEKIILSNSIKARLKYGN